MSTYPLTGLIQNDQNRKDGHPTMTKSNESQGFFKSKRNCNRKKKRLQKWAPLDFTALETTSEAENKVNVETVPDLASYYFGFLHNHSQYKAKAVSDAISEGEQCIGNDQNSWSDLQPSPSRVIDAASALGFRNGSAIYGSNETPNLSDTALADSVETKDKFAAVMAHLHRRVSPTLTSSGGDGFDSLNWDPDLPSASPLDKSPEPVSAEPHPIAYTTVGSVVNPNLVPQFSAPNRIQRAGAARRPLMTMTNREYDHLLQSHASQPALNSQNSMQYTQQLVQNSPTIEGDPSKITRPPYDAAQNLGPLTELEKQVLSLVNNRTPHKPMPNSGGADMSCLLRDLQGGNRNRASNSLGLSQGMEKMQTLQRLARFENPMQEHAINRLSEFSVANANMQTASHKIPNQANNLKLRYDESSVAQREPRVDTYNNVRDKAYQGYQFPQSVYGSSSTTQANPLFGAYSAPNHNFSAPNRPPTGYPQPLTAGPPGQRPYTSYTKSASFRARSQSPNRIKSNKCFIQNRATAGFTAGADNDFNPEMFLPSFLSSGYINDMENGSSAPDIRESLQDSEAASHSLHPSGAVQSVWDPTMQQRAKASDQVLVGQAYSPLELGPRTDIRDTLSPNSMAQYYPHGRPFHIGIYHPLSAIDESKIQALLDKDPAQREQELREMATNDAFYHGQRLYHMTAEQHIEELEKRQPEYETNPFGPIGPPAKKYPSVIKETITPEQMESMAVAEAAAPILDAAFSTLLAYSETSRYSRSKLSGWVQGPVRYIDNTVDGNKTMFGDGLGHTTKVTKPPVKPLICLPSDREKYY